MAIKESGEMYLETILVLSKTTPGVRSVDVGEYMGFSKPSVSRAMRLLREEGLIEIDRGGFITLTEKGKVRAESTYERHLVLTEWLTKIGVSPEKANDDACRVEHYISEETFQAIKKLL